QVQPDAVQTMEHGGLVMYLIRAALLRESDPEFSLAEVPLLTDFDDLQRFPIVVQRQVRDAESARGGGVPGLDEEFTASAQRIGGITRAQELLHTARPFPVAEERFAATVEGFA